ncbi:uncharacterized protein A4U43_C04F20310 [Asparagus officinalis]|uniref:Uncharacterized protein n=1 Tax=Asparagus officinalis TaxID=4686 RepID=A0A5P1F2Z2_ASPOF|nr:uncharacterized protein A4U43_C04F20310 [Asparagus officinalis]
MGSSICRFELDRPPKAPDRFVEQFPIVERPPDRHVAGKSFACRRQLVNSEADFSQFLRECSDSARILVACSVDLRTEVSRPSPEGDRIFCDDIQPRSPNSSFNRNLELLNHCPGTLVVNLLVIRVRVLDGVGIRVSVREKGGEITVNVAGAVVVGLDQAGEREADARVWNEVGVRSENLVDDGGDLIRRAEATAG